MFKNPRQQLIIDHLLIFSIRVGGNKDRYQSKKYVAPL